MNQLVEVSAKPDSSGKIEHGREYIPFKPTGDGQETSTHQDQHKGEAR